jgi:hypothetical protein
MIISKREITAALAHHTREAMRVKKAICAAATIQTTAILALLVCIALPMHGIYA